MRFLEEMSNEEYITISKAANHAGVSVEEINQAIHKGKLKSNNPVGSMPDKVCKKALEEVFAKAMENKNCKKLDLVQAAKFLKISRIEFYKLIEDGVFKTTGDGFDSQIIVRDLEVYLADRTSPEKENKT